MLFNRRAEEPGEFIPAAEVARHEEMQNGPQFTEVIFHGRAREAQTEPRRQAARADGGLGAGILDELRLVQHHEMEFHRGEGFDVPHQ